jgi:hypothetical protein
MDCNRQRWAAGDFSENTSLIAFPREELVAYTRHAFARLKAEQAKLIGETQKGSPAGR